MRYHPSMAGRIGPLLLAGALLTAPVRAQEPECDDPPLANAPISPDLVTFCAPGSGATCDLGIVSWDPFTHRSPALRMGDSFGSPDAERPRFFFDVAGNRYYTKLYVQFQNLLGTPAAASDVTVTYAFKETGDPLAVDDAAIPWQDIGTYAMNIPAPPGALYPGDTHFQPKGTCWHRPAGQPFPLQFILRAELHWPAGPDGNLDDDVAYSLYDLTAGERLAQIALALDLSGSMTEALPGGGTKLAEAKDKAELFTGLVEDGNQLGVYGFATANPANDLFDATYTGTDNLIHIEKNLGDTSQITPLHPIAGDLDRSAIQAQIFGQSAHGCTPVGQGLLRARAGLASLPPPAADAGKAIVLFSDGLQNVRPYVNTPAAFSCGGPATAADISANATFGNEGIEIYSIYFGPQVGWAHDLMEKFKETGGKYVYGATDGLGLAAAYYSIRALVDDMVYFEGAGTTSAGGTGPTFEVHFDAGAGVATAAVAWERGEGRTRLTLDYRRRGETDWHTAPALPTSGQGGPASFQVFRFTPGAGTTWELRVRQLAPTGATAGPATRYAAAVFTAVREMQLRPSLDDAGFSTGRALPLFADLRRGGHPVAGATVQAVVRVPARSFSTTLRNYRRQLAPLAPDNVPDTGRVGSMAAQLRALLARDTGADELYPYRDVPVTLRDDGQGADRRAGDGLYSGELPAGETHVAGDYQVTITASATLADGGKVTRTARLATVCSVGPADPEKSRIDIDLQPVRADGTRLATVTILPTDRFGNAAFPGSGRQVQVTARRGQLSGPLVDPLDASFTQELVVGPGEEPEVTVTVGGIALRPPTPVAPADRRREWSLHLGTATPHAAFSAVAGSGPSAALDLVQPLDAHLALRAEVGLSRFDRRGGGDLDLFNLEAWLRYRFTLGLWVPYLETGLGLYHLEGAGSGAGFAAGLGVERRLSPHVHLDLNLDRHRVGGGPDIDYSQARAGLLIRF